MINEKGVEVEGIVPLVFNGHEPFQIFQKNSDNKRVFGLSEINDTEGSFVEFQTKSPTKKAHQMWIRTPQEVGEKGRFMITNKESGLFLYADWHGYFTNGHITIKHEVLECKLSQNY